jgi:hypothetical protein
MLLQGVKVIKTVIRTKNDMVMVFDENGEELPQYQGNYRVVKPRILADAQTESVFNHWFGITLRPVKVSIDFW